MSISRMVDLVTKKAAYSIEKCFEYLNRKESIMKNKLTPFGQTVKIELLKRNMTIKDLAGQIGTSPTQVSRILYGERTGRKHMEQIKLFLENDFFCSDNSKK